MDYLYLLLNLGSLSIPFLFSFHPKLKFYRYWKSLVVGIVIGMLVFIPWDILFTKHNVWGFNHDYFLDITWFGLPMEEWLFFICIPYACVFTHFALLHYFPNMTLSLKSTKYLSYALISILLFTAILNYSKWYTLINFLIGALITFIVLKKNIRLLQKYYVTFLVMLIPFFLVNGILTGSFIENEVVWYNNNENLGIRLFTIPIEDTIYAFSLILINLFVVKSFEKVN
ncbi:lycopene cyclase domain-containing protein [Flavobacteriaceae bacterium XHP0103]|uniref:lycopene cyclase domain-containing protein n=1 Tax=Marixanthotalea marina TaxID=2844359 RepID=UPI002989CC3D|nr:lycopene cyclase domain-containing protein [Marixanthotalea marina]MBU3821391.1 lycopene cyclase domain-containing protein [Marixanthotalea marina]